MKWLDVLKIMKEKDWVYYNEPVNYNSVKSTIIRNTKDALNYMIEQVVIGEGCSGTVSCGGFEVTAMCSDDPNDDDIEIEIKFIPYSGFGDCSLSELKKLLNETSDLVEQLEENLEEINKFKIEIELES